MSFQYYSQISKFPLQNWLDANSGDLKATRIDYNKGSDKEDAKAFETLYNDFIDKVGLSDEFIELINVTERLAQLQIKYLETRERRLVNDMNILRAEISSLKSQLKGGETGNIYKVLNELGKMQGHIIRVSDLTTLHYFELIKSANTARK